MLDLDIGVIQRRKSRGNLDTSQGRAQLVRNVAQQHLFRLYLGLQFRRHMIEVPCERSDFVVPPAEAILDFGVQVAARQYTGALLQVVNRSTDIAGEQPTGGRTDKKREQEQADHDVV